MLPFHEMSAGRELTWNTRDEFEGPKNPEGSQGFDVKETGFREDAHEDTEGSGSTHKNTQHLKIQKNTKTGNIQKCRRTQKMHNIQRFRRTIKNAHHLNISKNKQNAEHPKTQQNMQKHTTSKDSRRTNKNTHHPNIQKNVQTNRTPQGPWKNMQNKNGIPVSAF